MPPEAPAFPPRRVAILGLGVMGGSLARALSALPTPPFLAGWSPDASERDAALVDGTLNAAPPEAWGALEDADLVVLAAPLRACVELVPTVLDGMPASAILTDVASLKGPVEAAVARAGGVERWAGSHPMCGSAASGYRTSSADLYQGALVWVVAHGSARTAAAVVDALWTAVGAHTMRTTSGEHDALMSLASHLPQLTANALGAVLRDAGVGPEWLGPGGRDMTRLAGSSPDMWRDLLVHADPALPEALRGLGRRASELADLVERRDGDALAHWMEGTRTWRDDT